MRTHRRAARATLILLLSLSATPAAHADSDAHYQDYLVGERAGGMGGAYTALANEASGAHYNPAGIVRPGSTIVQLAMSAYKLRLLSIEAADICGEKLQTSDDAFFSFPGSLGVVFPFSAGGVEHAIGFTLVVPSWERENQDFQIKDANCGALKISAVGSDLGVDRVFQGGLSYAVRPVAGLQLGLTVGTAARTFTYSGLSSIITNARALFPAVYYINGDVTVWSLYVQAGVIYEPPVSGLRLGLNFVSPQIRVAGKGRLDVIYTSMNPLDTSGEPSLIAEDAEWYWKVPFKVTLGAAWSYDHLLTIALDVSLHGPQGRYSVVEHPQLSRLTDQDEIPENQRNMVANVNLGAEFRVWRKLLLRAGLFTNFTSLPDDSELTDEDRVHRFGATLGGTYMSNPASALSFALQAQLGDLQGWSERVYSPTGKVADLTSESVAVRALDFSLIVSIGGSYDIR